MQKKPSNKARSRAEILAEIAALPPSIQGTISSYKCPRKNGPPAVYHNFQYTLKGKNHSMTIPVGMVTEFKNAIASGKKLRDLVLELSAADMVNEGDVAHFHFMDFVQSSDWEIGIADDGSSYQFCNLP